MPAAIPPAFAEAARLIAGRGGPAQLCVRARGAVAADLAFGCRPDSLFLLFSAGKPVVALAVHLLAERGALSLDDPVAAYWPQFGQRGKQDITIRHVLQHRAGLPVARGMPLDALAMADWEASVQAIEQAVPAYPPGQVAAHHVLTFGFVLGELVQRVTGTPVSDFAAAELLQPLGAGDVFLGLPSALWHRHVPVSGRGPAGLVTQAFLNRRSVREAVPVQRPRRPPDRHWWQARPVPGLPSAAAKCCPERWLRSGSLSRRCLHLGVLAASLFAHALAWLRVHGPATLFVHRRAWTRAHDGYPRRGGAARLGAFGPVRVTAEI